MPRRIALAAAGRYVLDYPPFPGIGRGGEDERLATLTSLSTAKLQEFLFEGGDPAYRTADVGAAVLIQENVSFAPSQGNQFLSFAAPTSIQYEAVDLMGDRQVASYPAGVYAMEIWYKQPDRNRGRTGGYICVISLTGNQNFMFGSYYRASILRTYRFPAVMNTFNGVLEWESFIDLYGDDKPHQLLELHEVGIRNNTLAVLDGVPIASCTTGGFVVNTDGQNGPAFNGRAGNGNQRAGASFGSATWYDNGQEITLQDARELYETSALVGEDMLTVPAWVPLDSVNCTFLDNWHGGAYKYLQAGDVANDTGARSGAIPRRNGGKTYFEVEVVNQGDNNQSARLGIRRMINADNVGSQLSGADVGHSIYVFQNTAYRDNLVSLGLNVIPDVASGLTNFETGVIFQVAIDWQTGKVWFGKNGNWNDTGDPANGTGELYTIDVQTNWAVHHHNADTSGNALVKLRSNYYELAFAPPAGFTAWVDKDYELEVIGYGPNHRRAEIENIGAGKEHEFFFEGVTAAEIGNDTGDRIGYPGMTVQNLGTDQAAIAFDSVSSKSWGATRGPFYSNNNWANNASAFELWFRQPDTGGNPSCLITKTGNHWEVLGRVESVRWPAAKNRFNAVVYWQSDVDLWADDVNRNYHLMEIHESALGSNYIVVLNGMPITSGNNGGWLYDGGGFEMNGDANFGNAFRSQGDFGSLTLYRKPEPLTLQDARRLYVKSKLNPTDQMLTLPRWFAVDGANVTAGGTGAKDLTIGDVSNDSGCRSGAIPNTGKVYFELFVIAQGDNTFGDIGIRKLIDPQPASDNAGVADGDALYMQGQTLYTGDLTTVLTAGASGLLDQSTGRTVMFAIDWSTGKVWVGTDGNWNGVLGTAPNGDPVTGANEAYTIDTDTDWAAWACGVGAIGNQQYRLVSATADLTYTAPTGFTVWEDV